MNSSFSHLEPSRAVPDPAELRSILSITRELEEEAKDLDSELSDLLERTEMVRQQLSSAQERVQYHQNLSSPLRRIPSEVLFKIFLETVPLLPAGPLGMTLASPWTLVPVCKRWHDVCLDYGALWGRIHLDRTFLSPEHPNFSNDEPFVQSWSLNAAPKVPTHTIMEAIRLLELQLSRSRDTDLFVTIQARPEFDYAQPYLRILLPHLRRCVSLTAPRHVIAHTPLGHCERLRHLEINHVSLSKHPDHPAAQGETPQLLAQEEEGMQVVTSLPKLVTYTAFISFEHVHDAHRSVALHLPERLTSIVLEAGGGGAGQILKPILFRLQSLVHIQVEDPVSYHTDDHVVREEDDPVQVILAHGTRAELPSLKSVSVRGPHVVSFILGNIIAPNLLELTNSGAVDKQDVLLDFLTISGCSLRKLDLRTRSRSEVVVELLQSKPDLWAALETLRIQFVKELIYDRRRGNGSGASELPQENGMAVIELLNRWSTSPDIFPSLTSIALAGSASPIREAIDMIESRCISTASAGISSPAAFFLRQVDLAHLDSLHRTYTDDAADAIVSGERKQRLIEKARNQHAEFDFYHEAHQSELSAEERRMGVNPFLSWAKGLQREADQEKRLSELQRKGLEVLFDASPDASPIRRQFQMY